MTVKQTSDQLADLSPVKRALFKLRELRARLATIEQAQMEPIAIIGLGCRFPAGADNPEAFWQLLHDGVDAISEVPTDRWDIDTYYDPDPLVAGKMSTRWGGFLAEIDKFDPHFFGIAPREAMAMDPQHRLMLEVSWEALEHAGQAPDKLAGSRTGVFIGISSFDYAQRLLNGNQANIDAYTASGISHSAAAGRLSYILGLKGPTISIDTACSSSLVAVHLGVQSLRNNECQMALVGGVNIILTPEPLIAFSKSQMLAADGRCKTFDARADGYARAEGCGMIVLKRLSDAQTNGDQILAVIRGSAVNQDGRSNGLTAPNDLAQEEVIREALANSGVEPTEVGYVETHGTGTSLGDPIEVQALAAALCQGRSEEDRLLIGSVKTNLGHLESAAGVAGLIKVVLALQHKAIPPHLHLQEPNPYISWDEILVDIPTQRIPFPSKDDHYIAGVSSFGFTGTNAHVVLEAAPAPESRLVGEERPLHLMTLSAKDEAAMKELRNRYDRYLTVEQAAFSDICFTVNTGRAHLRHRLAVIAESTTQAREKLAALAAGQIRPGVVSGEIQSPKTPQVVFLFSGQGSQYVEMGRQLYDTQPTFRAVLDRCDEILRPLLDLSLLEVLYPKPVLGEVEESKIQNPKSKIDETAYTQPALFALEYALAKLWQSWGIEPAAVMGHSIGEYVAACIAGVFSLEDGLKLMAARGRLIQALPKNGAMAAVFAEEAQVKAALAPYTEVTSIAAVNGPQNIVVSGETPAVQAVLAQLEAEGIRTRRLQVSHAFHSPLMELILAEFEQTARQVRFEAPRIPLVSNLTGQVLRADEVPEATYWRRHLREAVRFSMAIETLHQRGYALFLEVGPSPVLLAMARRCISDATGTWLPSLRQDRDDWQQMLESLATLYVRGAEVDWTGFDRDYAGEDHPGRRRVPLPTYPFQRQRYWVEVDHHHAVVQNRGPSLHPLLGHRLRLAGQESVFETQLSLNSHPLLADYRVHGAVVMPATAFMEMALVAGREVLQTETHIIEEMVIHQALLLPEDEVRTVQVVLNPAEGEAASFKILSLDKDASNGAGEGWRLLVTGKVRIASTETVASRSVAVEEVQHRCQAELLVSSHYELLRQCGVELGPSFQGIEHIWQGEREALGRLRLPDKLQPAAEAYQIHPVLLDAGLQLFGAALPEVNGLVPYMPLSLDHFQFYARPHGQVWSHLTVQPPNGAQPETLVGDVALLDEAGRLVAEVKGLSLRRAEPEALLQPKPATSDDWLYEIEWQQLQPAALAPATANLLGPGQVAERLQAQVSRLNQAPESMLLEELSPKLEALSTAYMVKACQQLGWTLRMGQHIQIETLAEELGVVSQQQRLFERLIQILQEDGVLERVGDEWQVSRIPETPDPQAQLSTLLVQYPVVQAELTLAGRCGQHLAEVLQGQHDPLELLFPGGSLAETEKLYQDSIASHGHNSLVQEAVTTILERLAVDQSIRILEIGGGTGGTTAYVLSRLPTDQVEYVFTDISPLFTTKARQKFQDYSFMKYETLDIERDPREQGFVEHQFDLILAANVLHATADLRQTLQHVQSLLAPEGLLVLLEGTGPQRLVDLTVGLTEGWWKFADEDLRPSYALISPQKWLNLLQELGFTEAVALPGEQDQAKTLSHQAMILARGPRQQPGSWTIFADGTGVGQKLAELFRSSGETCDLVYPGKAYEAVEPETWRIDPTCPDDYKRLFSQVLGHDRPSCRGVIFLWALDTPPSEETTPADLNEAQLRGCGGALYLMQALVAARETKPPGLWLVTRGAQVVGSKPSALAVAQATLWGLGKVIANEHPDLNCRRVDLESAAEMDQIKPLFAEIYAGDAEPQVAFRGTTRYVARLVSAADRSLQTEQGRLARESQVKSIKAPIGFRPDGTYWIIGGFGGMGLLVAQWMVEHGARHLVLMGRSGASEASREVLRELEQAGAQVEIAHGDVSQEEQVAKVLTEIAHSMPPLRGIIHSAAVLDDGVLLRQNWERFAKVLAPKVQGAWNLHTLTKNMSLDFFVLFSTAASLFGPVGLGNYTVSNTFLDALALYRWNQGLPALSINWGPWGRVGIAEAVGNRRESQWTAAGMNTFTPQQALAALGQLLRRRDSAQVGAFLMDWSKFIRQANNNEQLFVSELLHKSQLSVEAEQSSNQLDLQKRLDQAPAKRRYRILLTHVREKVMRVLGLGPSYSLGIQQPLQELGLDSLMAVELRNLLGLGLELPRTLPATLAFDYPTVEALTGYLAQELLSPTSDSTEPQTGSRGEDQDEAEEMARTQLEQLSDDEVEQLLLAELKQIQEGHLDGDN